MAVQTARRIITRVMRGLGYIGRTADPTANDAADALDTFNDMFSGWNREPLMTRFTVIMPVPLVPSQYIYTIGPSGDINITLPEKLERASLLIGSGSTVQEQPIRCIQTVREWQQIVDKGATSDQVLELWLDVKAPLGDLYVHPISNTVATMLLYLQGKFDAIPTLDTQIIVPDGLYRAIRYNLGVELAPELQKELPPLWLSNAVQSKAVIKSSNIIPGKLQLNETMGTDSGGSYNVFTDHYH